MMHYQTFSSLFGLSIWLVGTLVFRFLGHTFFMIEQPFFLVAFFLGTLPVLFFLAKWVFKRYQLNKAQQLKSAVFLVVPGMFCDTFCIFFHQLVFPQLSIQQAIVLGAWLLWAYLFVLLIGLMPNLKEEAIPAK